MPGSSRPSCSPAPLALYNSARFDGLLSDKTTLLLDIGAENTDLIIASPAGLWTRTIPLGGNSFTDTLVKSFKLSFSKAENLKRTAATSKYARQIFQTMRPIFADLVQELQRSIGFYTSTHRDAELVKAVGLGNAFKLPGLQKYLQQNLGLDVARPESFAKLTPVAGADVSTLKENLLSFAVAYGLAVAGAAAGQDHHQPVAAGNRALGGVAEENGRSSGPRRPACCSPPGAIWARQFSDISTLNVNKGPPAAVNSVEDADRIIQQGPSGTTAGDQARQIVAAAQKLRSEYDKVGRSGQRGN